MIHGKKKRFLCGALLIVLFAAACGKKDEIRMTVGGDEGLAACLEKATAAYGKTRSVRVRTVGMESFQGLESLLNGESDIAVLAIKMPGNLSQEARKKKMPVTEVVIGYDVIVPIAHPSNPVKNLFLGQLTDMYTGLIRDWKEVEGVPGIITVVDREPLSSIKQVMSERFFHTARVPDESLVESSDEAVVAKVAADAGAIGYISRVSLSDGVKALSINRMKATDENVRRNNYRLFREIYVYYDDAASGKAVKEFVAFLVEKEGQEMMREAGFMPVMPLE